MWGGGRSQLEAKKRRQNVVKVCMAKGHEKGVTLQPEIITKIILKTLFFVTDMRFRRKIIPRQVFYV